MTKLVDGLIPAHTECPYRTDCGDYGAKCCIQKGVDHTVDFSCGFARAFEISKSHNIVKVK